MNSTPTGASGPRADGGIAEYFLAGTLPAMLSPLRALMVRLHPDLSGIGMLLIEDHGARASYWADADGRVQVCPDAIAALPDNPTLSRCGASGQLQSSLLRADPLLDWAAGEDACPLIVLPVSHGRRFHGFMVIQGYRNRPPSAIALGELSAWGPLAADMVARGIEAVHALIGITRFAHDFTLMRDHETGRHQCRLTAYLRILGTEMSRAHGLPHGFAEELTLFGPLHDIGKVGIPDEILLKPGRFEPLEWELMKEHVTKGSELVGRMSDDLGLAEVQGLETLRTVVACHHEYLDGSGYPSGRGGDDIPLAARMVTIADIFDALTCMRPYKRPWTIDEALAHLAELAADDKLDRDCVQAFAASRDALDAALRAHLGAAEAQNAPLTG